MGGPWGYVFPIRRSMRMDIVLMPRLDRVRPQIRNSDAPPPIGLTSVKIFLRKLARPTVYQLRWCGVFFHANQLCHQNKIEASRYYSTQGSFPTNGRQLGTYCFLAKLIKNKKREDISLVAQCKIRFVARAQPPGPIR